MDPNTPGKISATQMQQHYYNPTPPLAYAVQPQMPIEQQAQTAGSNVPSIPYYQSALTNMPTAATTSGQTEIPSFQKKKDNRQIANAENWKTVPPKKRPCNSSDKQMRTQKQTRTDYWLSAPVATSNRYEDLDMEEEVDENNQQKESLEKQPKPPPIFVDGVSISRL
jgi:hypothetical protein